MIADLLDLEEIYNYDLTDLSNLNSCDECEMRMFSSRSFCMLKMRDRNSAGCKKLRKSQIEKNKEAKKQILAAIEAEIVGTGDVEFIRRMREGNWNGGGGEDE